MNTTVVTLDECFPNPDATYLIRSTEEVRVRGDSDATDAQLRTLVEAGAQAWTAGLQKWTNVPGDVLGTWVRNARHEVRWASLSDIAAYADGIDEAYSRSAGWVRLQRESEAADPQYEGRSQDFLAWRARHADTARVAWEVPYAVWSAHDVSSEDQDRFAAIANALTSADRGRRQSALAELVAFVNQYGNNSRHEGRRARMAEAGIVESLAYLIEEFPLEHWLEAIDSFRYLFYADLDRGFRRIDDRRVGVFSDIAMNALLNKSKQYDQLWLHIFGIIRDHSPSRILYVMRPSTRAKWATAAYCAKPSSIAHLEACFQLLSADDAASPEPVLIDAVLRPSAFDINNFQILLIYYIDMFGAGRGNPGAEDLSRALWVDRSLHTLLGLANACEASPALRGGLSPLAGRLEEMVKGFEPLRFSLSLEQWRAYRARPSTQIPTFEELQSDRLRKVLFRLLASLRNSLTSL